MSVKKLAKAAAMFGARPVADAPGEAVEASVVAGCGGSGGAPAPAAGAGFDSGGNEDGAVGSDIDMCDEVKTSVVGVNPSR